MATLTKTSLLNKKYTIQNQKDATACSKAAIKAGSEAADLFQLSLAFGLVHCIEGKHHNPVVLTETLRSIEVTDGYGPATLKKAGGYLGQAMPGYAIVSGKDGIKWGKDDKYEGEWTMQDTVDQLEDIKAWLLASKWSDYKAPKVEPEEVTLHEQLEQAMEKIAKKNKIKFSEVVAGFSDMLVERRQREEAELVARLAELRGESTGSALKVVNG